MGTKDRPIDSEVEVLSARSDAKIKEQMGQIRREVQCLEKWEDKFEQDRFHSNKRRLSFALLDLFIDSCAEYRQCPRIEEWCECYLTDICLVRYVKQRAYYYYVDGIGTDDDDRHYLASKRVNGVLDCQERCTIEPGVFLVCTDTIVNNKKIAKGIRQRKAFWNFKRFKPHNNPSTDYQGACGFVERYHGTSFKALRNKKDDGDHSLDVLNSCFENEFHLINGMELFQYCVIRNGLSSPSA